VNFFEFVDQVQVQVRKLSAASGLWGAPLAPINCTLFSYKFILPYWGLTGLDFGFLDLSNASID
jgi:hypothetical protein